MAPVGDGAGRCAACGSADLEPFYEVQGIPVQSTVLLDGEEEARAFPTGDLRLARCTSCDFIQNVLFDPDLVDYSLPTEESQAFSPRFTEYASALAARLVEELGLAGGTVLEVGSGKGEFLVLLAGRGIGRGVGIDPGFLPERLAGAPDRLEFLREFYGPDRLDMTGDLILARHLIEHVPNVREFLGWLASSASRTEGATVFIEVPDTRRILEENAFWDVYYEHCSYFTTGSMRSALWQAGLEPVRVELAFGDQYIHSWARPAGQRSTPVNEGDAQAGLDTARFGREAAAAVARWRSRIEETLGQGQEVVVWGASSKAVSFLSAVGPLPVTVVDINPHKQGKWLPGVSLLVEGPVVLADRDLGLVIPMNPIYTEEIGRDLAAMGQHPPLTPVV